MSTRSNADEGAIPLAEPSKGLVRTFSPGPTKNGDILVSMALCGLCARVMGGLTTAGASAAYGTPSRASRFCLRRSRLANLGFLNIDEGAHPS
jgi:hypothetical protein